MVVTLDGPIRTSRDARRVHRSPLPKVCSRSGNELSKRLCYSEKADSPELKSPQTPTRTTHATALHTTPVPRTSRETARGAFAILT
ncbi:hypothetical protein PybrP1_003028 [[Pythium] brassicae (nom. inval.)]|nr:hypothetical protein PybrP1_003028 [[Pythium] brassicae (nom. inval.)]